MHRLLSVRNIYPKSFHNFTSHVNFSSKNASQQNRGFSCSYCRKLLGDLHNLDNVLRVRHQSTKTANMLQKHSKKKPKHKKYKKYGEVLEVNDKNMTESKVSISNLRADHLSQIASSSVSLGQLHELTKPKKKSINPETELVKTIVDNIIKKEYDSIYKQKIHLEDDKCALIFTRHNISCIEDQLRTDSYINKVKESYTSFMKETLYDQRLKGLSQAITEGLNQEFDLSPTLIGETPEISLSDRKGAHAIFREFLTEYQQNYNLDNPDQEFIDHVSRFQSRGMPHPALDEMYADDVIPADLGECRDDLELDALQEVIPNIKPFNIKIAQEKLKAATEAKSRKKKSRKERHRAAKEKSMRGDMKEIERRGKEEALNKLLAPHLQLLCSLGMLNQAQQILLYYRSKSAKGPDQPRIKDVRVYNILLHGFAAEGDYTIVSKILAYMDVDKMQTDAQTYAAVFECIERSTRTDKVILLKKHLEDMSKQNITLNDLLDKAKFVRDQMETVHSAIKRIEPKFTPQYTPPNLDYICPLLDSLKIENKTNREGLKKSPAEGLMTVEELKRRVKLQLQNEINGEIEVENIELKGEPTETILYHRKKIEECEREWKEVIREAFVRNISTLKSQSNASHNAITLYPYLKVLEVDQFVDLIMGEMRKLVDGSESYSPTLKLLQRDLGTRVYNKYQIEQYRQNGVLDEVALMYDKYCEWYVEREEPLNARQAWQTLLHRHRPSASLDIEEMQWPLDVRQNIGKFLYNIIINDIKIDVNMFRKTPKQKKLPAVYRLHRPWGRLVRLEIKPHPLLARLCRGAARPALHMRTPLAPLLCPAAPWTNHRAGAYLLTPPPLIRMPFNVVQQWKRIEEAPAASLYPVMDSLNQLGEVPWRINEAILELQLHVFRSGGSKDLDIAQPPSALDTSQFVIGESKADVFKRRIAINRARAEMYSLWCDALYKLSLANHYKGEIFWLPHNMDFRGRVYACPPHVSQLGADSARALLLFAKKQPLGPHGLKWLKLHAINLTGTMKKKTLDERLQYADSILDKILDSADRPLDGQRWWAQSEEPWQTLASCMEIANAVRSPNPEEYECGFPVHQDGSCNGLQHYAALGGDSTGAAAVNLAPKPAPQDVYSAVAALVEEMRVRDAANGVAPALILENFVRRKVIKQTVMTTVYGVTRFGARLQIAKQLKDIKEFPKEHIWSCSSYLTVKTFDSLREMFTSTKEIQDWLTDCARLISGVCGESVEWVTPLGLPVVQPYHRRMTVPRLPNADSLSHHAPLDYHQRPCTVKQKNAFPPNFIHSLDSSHMMLTSLQCQARGVTFVSVHDCFWTHPDTIHTMNEICREQFVALHSQPILKDLSTFLVERYSYPESEISEENNTNASKRRVNSLLSKVPSKGDFQLENVLKSIYFFS